MEKKAGINKVEVSGNLVKDAEFKALPSGAVVANFRIAVNRTYKDRSGEEKKETTFLNISATPKGEQEAAFEALLKKGAGVYVRGTITCHASEKDGVKREFFGIRAFEVEGLPKAKKEEKAA